MTQEGPTIRIEKHYNCKGCKFLIKGESWVEWGASEAIDWGNRYVCGAEQDKPREISRSNIIGSTVITPGWCPFKD